MFVAVATSSVTDRQTFYLRSVFTDLAFRLTRFSFIGDPSRKSTFVQSIMQRLISSSVARNSRAQAITGVVD